MGHLYSELDSTILSS